MVLDVFDDVDRGLVQALQIDGRAPFRRIAEALGVSDQTVARRYARLRSTNALRVLGLVDPVTVGDVPWSLRVRCAPDAAPDVADALARRPDTRWISLTGAAEVLAGTSVDPRAGADGFVLGTLARTPQVVDVEAQQVLHTFFGGARSVVAKIGVLGPAAVEHLSAGVPEPVTDAGASASLERVDRRLLDALHRDGRTSVEDLARVTGSSASTVRRRLHELRAAGTLFFDVDFDHGILDIRMRTMLWAAVAPAHLEAAGRALAGHPEVPYVAATTGRHNLQASLATPDAPALYRYLTTQLAALEGVREVETAPVTHTVKAAGTHYPARGR